MTTTQTQTTEKIKLIDLNEITAKTLTGLDARSQDIIIRRFGLAQEKRETLESIGKEYSITRERVRQIESNAKKTLTGLKNIWRPVDELIADYFMRHGGLLTEEYLVELLRDKLKSNFIQNKLHFYLEILPGYSFVLQDAYFKYHWRQANMQSPHAENIVKSAGKILKNHNAPQKESVMIKEIRGDLGLSQNDLPDQHIIAALKAGEKLTKTVFGEWGMNNWPEADPRGVGDKAYAVMRRHNKPEHFREITSIINQAGFDNKKANPQTVHNELIKDDRFVLVGRGLYALKEWGFINGTVADVLESLIKTAGEPLSKEELIEQVLKQRLVKKNTILLSLQNNKRFVKNKENRYTLKEHS